MTDPKQSTTADGELYIGGQSPPPSPSRTTRAANDDTYFAEGPRYELDGVQPDVAVLYERILARWKDPTSPPHAREVCVKWAKWPGGKTCVGWKLEYRWIYRTAVLKVTTGVDADIGKAVESCLTEAAIMAAVAAIVSGGSAAVAAAEAALKACLLRKLGENLLTVSVTITTSRGPWE
jgi:hypothetical protein